MDLAALLENVRDIDIETHPAGDESTRHRTTIWPSVVEGEVYVRSFHGKTARWYREAVADPDVVVHANGEQLPVRAVAATDPQSIDRASAGYRRKYTDSPALGPMTRTEIHPTTLRLIPR